MKVHYLHIKNYKQFSDLELDLAYPKGHPKAGQPLDKICIIGQSGTGKTNLLDIVKKSTIDFFGHINYLPFSEFTGDYESEKYITSKFVSSKQTHMVTLFTSKKSTLSMEEFVDERVLGHEKVYFVGANKCIFVKTEDKVLDEKSISVSDKTIIDGLRKERKAIEYRGISFEGSIEKFENKIISIDEKIKSIEDKYAISQFLNRVESDGFIKKNIIDINEESSMLWSVMREKIDNYQVSKIKYMQERSNKLLVDPQYDKEHFKKDMETWESSNENLLEKIAENINFVLKKFNLELTKIDENQQGYNGLTIKDLSNGAIVEYDNLSTGTKNLLSTLIPLKTYAPKDSVILIDEPEMSFYPDIQRQLTSLYMEVGENNQLILATHSPLIASSFEPWEVVELKFDEKNQIYREKYYKGENHVDNYSVDPRLLTWTSILTDVFDLQVDSNFNEREKSLMEYASLKAEIKAMQNKETVEAERKIKRLKRLSQLLGLQN